MPLGQNLYYTNPYVGQIAQNLGAAIFGNPEVRMKQGLYESEADRNAASAANSRAEAGLNTEKGRGVRLQNDATVGLPASLKNLYGAAYPDADTGGLAGLLTAGGGNAEQIAKGLQSLFATLRAAGSPDQMRQSSVLQGGNPGVDFSPTGATADANQARDAASKLAEGVAVAGANHATDIPVANVQAGSAANVAGINNAGAMSRLFATPLNTPANSSTHLAPTDPRAASMGATLYGPVTEGAGRAPMNVTGKEMDDTVLTALQGVPGAVTINKATGGQTISPEFEAQFPPEKIIAAHTALANTLQSTRNAQAAATAYLQALGVQGGSTFKPAGYPSWIGGSGPASIVPPANAVVKPGSDPIGEARQAIARGAPRDAVIQRLRANGIAAPGDL